METPNIPIFPKYTNPAGDEYPIIANNNYMFPHKENPSTLEEVTKNKIIEVLHDIKECGFNAAIWIPEGIQVKYWEDLISYYYQVAADQGVRTILNLGNSVPRVMQKGGSTDGITFGNLSENGKIKSPTLKLYAEILNRNKDDYNLWGYKLKDEPSFEAWSHLVAPRETGKPEPEDIFAAYCTYLQNANGHVGHFNLAVSTGADWIGETLANEKDNAGKPLSGKLKYKKYLQAFKAKFEPSMLSVDLYPVVAQPPKTTTFFIKNFYYYFMEAIGEFSTETGMPFWMYILSNQHQIYKKNEDLADAMQIAAIYPSVTEGLLRHQAMTTLAYGFQGIVFWTYGVPRTSDSNPEVYCRFGAPLDVAGNRTLVWYMCQSVITEIKEFAKLLLHAKFQSARHVYSTSGSSVKFTETTEFIPKNDSDSNSGFECVTNAVAYGRGFVITHLTKGAEHYLAIVSHEYEEKQKIDVWISDAYDLIIKEYQFEYEKATDLLYKSKSFHSEPKSGTDPTSDMPTISKTLEPGEMILIKYTKR